MAKIKQNYSEAVTELESILFTLENDKEINLDAISVKVKRAAELINYCKKQLTELDMELEKVMGELNN